MKYITYTLHRESYYCHECDEVGAIDCIITESDGLGNNTLRHVFELPEKCHSCESENWKCYRMPFPPDHTNIVLRISKEREDLDIKKSNAVQFLKDIAERDRKIYIREGYTCLKDAAKHDYAFSKTYE